MGGGRSKESEGSSSSSSSGSAGIRTRTVGKKKQKQSSVSPSSSGGVMHDSAWADPCCFRDVYNEGTGQIQLPGAPSPLPPHSSAAAPNASALAASLSAHREHFNELFFNLATNSAWQQQQVRALFSVYTQCCMQTAERVLNLSAFSSFFFGASGSTPTVDPPFPSSAIRRLFFSAFEPDEDGLVSFSSFVTGMERLVLSRRKEKMRILFDAFDSDADGSWSPHEARVFLRTAMPCIKHLTMEALEHVELKSMLKEEKEFERWRSEVESSVADMQMQTRAMHEAEATRAAEAAAAVSVAPVPSPALGSSKSLRSVAPQHTAADFSSAQLISFAAFRSWAGSRLRVKPLFARFDVLPSAYRERDRISALWKEHGEHMMVGETWFVMSASWWKSWKAYSGFREPGEETETNSPHALTPTHGVGGLSGAGGNGLASALDAAVDSSADADDVIGSPFLISDTDTDSDREEREKRNAAQRTTTLSANMPLEGTSSVRIEPIAASPNGPATGALSALPPLIAVAPSTSRHVPPSSPIHSPTAIRIRMAPDYTQPASAISTVAPSAAVPTSAAPVAGSGLPSARRNSASAGGVTLQMTPHGAAVTAAASSLAASTAAITFPELSPSPLPSAAGHRRRGGGPAAGPAAPRPTAIDLSDLASPRNSLLLRQPLTEHEDFVLLPAAIWRALEEMYGVSGSLVFPRRVVEVGRDGARTKRVELYPLSLRVFRVSPAKGDAPNPSPAPSAGVPKEGATILVFQQAAWTGGDLERRMQELFFPEVAAAAAAVAAVTANAAAANGAEKLAPTRGPSPAAASPSPAPLPLPSPPAAVSASIVTATACAPTSPSAPALTYPAVRLWLSDSNDYRMLSEEDMGCTLEALELQNEEHLLVELSREPAAAVSAATEGKNGTSKSKRSKSPPSPAPSVAAVGAPVVVGGASSLSPPKDFSWPMDSRPRPRPFCRFALGDQLDAKDKQEIWYNAVVRKLVPATTEGTIPARVANKDDGPAEPETISDGHIVVNFIGWEEKWNESIPVSALCRCRGPCICSGRLAPLGRQVRFKKDVAVSSSSSVVPAPAATAASSNSSKGSSPAAAAGAGLTRGLCGLGNLGNTCFMASTLQCLSHTPIFISKYFLAGKYMQEINKSNALGHKGLVALEFGALMSDLWSGSHRSVYPTKLKKVLADFAPQFDGYQQHDSHELLAFLLDGLHEDLNRVKKKVPTNPVESNGRSDATVVKESWSVYKLRNSSIVVDLFQGMLKSTLICPRPECQRVSVTFDSFRYLTVPLPAFHDRQFIVTVCLPSLEPMRNFGIVLSESASVGELKSKLSTLCGIPLHKLLLCDVYKSKLYRVLMDSKRVNAIRDSDVLIAYEMTSDAFRAESAPGNVPATPTASLSSSTSSGSQSQSMSGNSAAPSSARSSGTSVSSTSPAAAAAANPVSPPPVLRSDMCYLQAIHKYILRDATTGQATMSSRFGIPVCLTTTPGTTNKRIHNLVAKAIQRWIPHQPASSDSTTDAASPPSSSSCGYTVRVVDHSCARCGLCAEGSNCGGCPLADDDRPCRLDGSFALCILWRDETTARQVKAAMDDRFILSDPSLSLKPRNMQSDPLRLAECLDAFSLQEKLTREDAWFCSRCKEHVEASKQLQLFHAPEILIIHLKRFIQVSRARREKNDSLVTFPLKALDLTPWIPAHALAEQPTPVYDLFAVSNHVGGMGGGHYTAFALHADTQKWFLFDDSAVREVMPNQIQTPYAYMLMYKRRV